MYNNLTTLLMYFFMTQSFADEVQYSTSLDQLTSDNIFEITKELLITI